MAQSARSTNAVVVVVIVATVLSACSTGSASPVEAVHTHLTTTTSLGETNPTATSSTTAPPARTASGAVMTLAPPPAPTTTGSRCPPNPFTPTLAEGLADRYPGALVTAHVVDLSSLCEYSLHPENRQRTASVFKVLVLAGTLLEAQTEQRQLTTWELSRLTPMITRSTNPQVRSLWRSFGGSPWFREQVEAFGLTETEVSGDDGSAWGLTRTSARDQTSLLIQLLLGHRGPLTEPYRKVAVDLMTSVIVDQTWGVTAGVPDGWTVAQKNGFAGITINSVGWVDPPGPDEGYVVAVLSQGWGDHPTGIAAVEEVSRAIAWTMTQPVTPVGLRY